MNLFYMLGSRSSPPVPFDFIALILHVDGFGGGVGLFLHSFTGPASANEEGNNLILHPEMTVLK